MRLGAGILLLVDAVAFGALTTFMVWMRQTYTVGSHALVFMLAPLVAFVGLNAYAGARLIFAWLRELAARHAAKIEQF